MLVSILKLIVIKQANCCSRLLEEWSISQPKSSGDFALRAGRCKRLIYFCITLALRGT